MTLDAGQGGARPTLDYDRRYGGAPVRLLDDRHVRRGGVQRSRRHAVAAVRRTVRTGPTCATSLIPAVTSFRFPDRPTCPTGCSARSRRRSRPSGPRVRRPLGRGARQVCAASSGRRSGDRLSVLGDRRLGGGARQPVLAGRPGARLRDGPLLGRLARARRAPRPDGRLRPGRLAPGRVARRLEASSRPTPPRPSGPSSSCTTRRRTA